VIAAVLPFQYIHVFMLKLIFLDLKFHKLDLWFPFLETQSFDFGIDDLVKTFSLRIE
jgi:hypothetical protein